MSQKSIIGRLFLVGCPRSGTTLLQCLLASHSQIVSLPETAFFCELIAGQRRRRLLGIAPTHQQGKYRKFLSLVGDHPGLHPPRHPLFVAQYVHAFTSVMDRFARLQGKTVWLEKTPQHVRRIPQIERYVPGAKFIHIVRNGPDNIASLYHVSNNYTELWKYAWSVDECIKHWVTDVSASLRYAGKPNHLFLGYKQVVEETSATLQRTCEFIGLPFEETALQKYTEVASRIVPLERPFKVGAQQPISNRNGTKFYEIFTEEQRQYIIKRVAEVDLTPLNVL